MRKILILLTSLIVLLNSWPVSAQEPLRLPAVEVKIYPEFDRRAVLVITKLSLPPDLSLPATINFRVPADSELNAVAVDSPEQGLVNAYYEMTPGEMWNTLAIRATTPTVWVEYYAPLQIEGIQRFISYQWPGDMAVDSFVVIFQVPRGAENVSITPLSQRSEVDSYQLRNLIMPVVSLDVNESYAFSARYEKADDQLSASDIQIEPVIPLEETGGQVPLMDALPWAVGVLGVALLVFGLVVSFSFRKDGKQSSRRVRQRRASKEPHDQGKSEETARYCPACGNRARPGDQFCRTCGVRLRQEEKYK